MDEIVLFTVIIAIIILALWLLSLGEENANENINSNSKYKDAPIPNKGDEYILFKDIDDLIHLIQSFYQKCSQMKLKSDIKLEDNFKKLLVRYDKAKSIKHENPVWHSKVPIETIMELFNIRLYLVELRAHFIISSYNIIKPFISENAYNMIKYQGIRSFAYFIEALDSSTPEAIGLLLDEAIKIKSKIPLKEKAVIENLNNVNQQTAFVFINQFFNETKDMNDNSYLTDKDLQNVAAKNVWYLSLIAIQIKELKFDGEILWYYLEKGFQDCKIFLPHKDTVRPLSKYFKEDFNPIMQKVGKAFAQAKKKIRNEKDYESEIKQIEKVEKLYKDKLISDEERKKMRNKILGID